MGYLLVFCSYLPCKPIFSYWRALILCWLTKIIYHLVSQPSQNMWKDHVTVVLPDWKATVFTSLVHWYNNFPFPNFLVNPSSLFLKWILSADSFNHSFLSYKDTLKPHHPYSSVLHTSLAPVLWLPLIGTVCNSTALKVNGVRKDILSPISNTAPPTIIVTQLSKSIVKLSTISNACNFSRILFLNMVL